MGVLHEELFLLAIQSNIPFSSSHRSAPAAYLRSDIKTTIDLKSPSELMMSTDGFFPTTSGLQEGWMKFSIGVM